MVTITLSTAGAKKAAGRLREFLAADGIRLKQTHAYEALAQTLGYANWNTLQALLNATALADPQAVPTDEELRADLVRAGTALQQRQLEKGLKPIQSSDLENSLRRAVRFAAARHHQCATPEHLLLALTEDQDAVPAMQACGVDIEQLRHDLTEFLDGEPNHLMTTESGSPKPSADFQRVIQRAAIHAKASGDGQMTGAYVLVAIFSVPECFAVEQLKRLGITRLSALNYVSNGIAPAPRTDS